MPLFCRHMAATLQPADGSASSPVKQINSKTSSTAAATPLYPLTDVLQSAPRLLQMLNSKALSALASTSRQVRSVIHEHVTSVTIIEHNGYGTEYQVTELAILVHGSWPQLQHLNLKYRARLEPGAVAQLARAQWSNLVSLDLSRNSLGEAGMSQLVAGSWPALKAINLSHNKLDTAAIACFIKADWSLENIELRCGCDLPPLWFHKLSEKKCSVLTRP